MDLVVVVVLIYFFVVLKGDKNEDVDIMCVVIKKFIEVLNVV